MAGYRLLTHRRKSGRSIVPSLLQKYQEAVFRFDEHDFFRYQSTFTGLVQDDLDIRGSPGLPTITVGNLTGVQQKTVWLMKQKIDQASQGQNKMV
jgi:hypothetical protein